jgi:thiosulfate/3-mercaptopyruvate sulfurtransferase
MNSLARGLTASAAGRYPVALYGSDRQRESRGAPAGRGFTHLSTLSDALSQPDRLQKLPHFEQLVYPQWLHDLQQGKAVTAAPAGLESD